MIRRLAAAAVAFYKREPARCNTFAAAALSWLLLKVGLEVDDDTVLLASTSVLALAAGELTRLLVTPTVKRPASTEGDKWDGSVRLDPRSYIPSVLTEEEVDMLAEPDGWQPSNPGVRKPQA